MTKRGRDDAAEVRHAIELICGRPARTDEVEGASLTPLERQVVELKEMLPPSTVLMVACGYRVKIYGRDSQAVSRRCGIMCIPGQPFVYSSFPYTRVDLYVHRLVSMGYHVAFADQESAAVRAVEGKSGIFKRTVSQVYSRGTLLPSEHVKTIGNSGDASSSSNSGGGAKPAEGAEEEEEGEEAPMAMAATAAHEMESSDLFLCFMHPTSSTEMDIILVSFVLLQRHVFHIRTALELEDVIRHHDIVELILLTSEVKNSKTPLAALDEDYVHVLYHILPLHFGPTPNGEEDGKTVCVTLFSPARAAHSLDAMIESYLEPFKLGHVYAQLTGGDGSTHAATASAPTEAPSANRIVRLPGTTLRALDLLGSSAGAKGSVLHLLDHSTTVCGARRLRAWLVAPLGTLQGVLDRQNVVDFLLRGGDGGCVEELLRECSKVGDVEATMGKLYAKRCGVLEYIRVLRMARSVCLLAKEAKESATAPLPPLLEKQFSLCSSSVIEQFLRNHTAELNSTATNPLDFFTEKGMAVPQRLQDLMKARDGALSALDEELERVKRVLQLPGLEYRTISGTPFLLDIPSSKTGKVEPDWLVLTRTKTNVRYHTPVIMEQNTALCAARERLVAGANEEWEQKQHELATNFAVKEALGGLIDAVATLDALRSLSITSGGAGYVRPIMTAAGSSAASGVVLKGARHPVLDKLLPGGYVGCDVQMAAGGTWLLTGPNMGGKSAFMRMMGLLAVMAQMGCYVPAVSAQLPVFSGVYCRMGASDSILEGSSTFLTEMDETNRILRAEGLSTALVLMDELGRGTSSFDGAAVAAATLEYLLHVQATVIFVTHYSYICEPYAHRTDDRVACYYMGFEEQETNGEDGKKEKKLVFTYQPCRGITPSSFGVEVAQLAGLPACVTEEAKRLSTLGEKEQAQRFCVLKLMKLLKE